MNKKLITVLAALLILSLPLTGCRSIVKGSGRLYRTRLGISEKEAAVGRLRKISG
ncbi:MAG: hypothetical protein WC369_06565 [Dehalococcoidales bacterium]